MCGLALAVVGMHHVPLAPHCGPPDVGHHDVAVAATPAASPSPEAGECGMGAGHDLLHLCLVVLSASATLLLAWLPVATHAAPGIAAGHRTLITRLRDPPRLSGKDLLTSVCVSRT